MIFFDWEKLVALSNGKPKNMIRILAIHTYGIKMPRKKKYLSRFFGHNLAGDSYLLNPKGIFKNKLQVSFEDMVMYIHVASLRNYLDYEWQGVKTLPLRYTEIDRIDLEENPLLEIDDQDNIKFYYEEEKYGN